LRKITRVRTWLQRTALMVAMIGVSALTVEGGVRLIGLAPAGGVHTMTEREFARLPGSFMPGQQRVERAGTPLEHRVRIDSLGYRGSSFPRAKPEGELRVVYTGDSFTWGSFVDDHQTLPAMLQERLEARCPAWVINAGVPGVSIEGAGAMALRSLPLQPDAAILMFFSNDIDDLLHVRMWEQLALNRRSKSQFPMSLAYPMLRHTATWNLALQATRQRRLKAGLNAVGAPATMYRSAEPARAEYETRLLALRDSLAIHRLPLLFVAYPSHLAFSNRRASPDYEWALAAAADAGLPVLDLLPPLLAAGLSVTDLYLLPHDGHPTPRGYALMSEHVADFFVAHSGICVGS
jgi:lysophospholipase L1-like esterase